MTALPKAYAWLAGEPGPRLLVEFLRVYGVSELQGEGSNPTILSWAKSIGLKDSYKADSIPWCGLAMAYAAAQAGWEHAPKGNALWARNWLYWGTPAEYPMLGDVLIFSRGSSGHVGVYVGEDTGAYHVIGGNQGDRVSFARKPKARLLGARRCPWRINQPPNVRRVFLAAGGSLMGSET